MVDFPGACVIAAVTHRPGWLDRGTFMRDALSGRAVTTHNSRPHHFSVDC